jgi:hypothetical protein
MTGAIFGLIGVVVGGLISGGLSLILEWRKERVAARVAARLIREDLLPVSLGIEDVFGGRAWLRDPDRRSREQSWVEHRSRLATVMKYEDYAAVVQAQIAADRFEAWFAKIADRSRLDESDRNQLRSWNAEVGDGLSRLLEVAE